MIAFWTVLSGPMGDPFGKARLPVSLALFVAMLCVIRLFYWSYLDLAEEMDDNMDPANLSMSVFKIQINPPAIEAGNTGVEVERVFPKTNPVKATTTFSMNANTASIRTISTPPIMTVAESSEKMTSPTPRLLSAKKTTRRDSYSSDSYAAGDSSGFSCRTTMSEVHCSGEE